jgi:hypothetical protein
MNLNADTSATGAVWSRWRTSATLTVAAMCLTAAVVLTLVTAP